jgi:threonine dehydrogenase-like Zn-dependent dehydrogenase
VQSAFDVLDRAATMVLVGLGSDDPAFVGSRLIYRETTLIGSYVMSVAQREKLMSFVMDTGLDLEPIISGRYTLEEGPEAFAAADAATGGKPILRVGATR